MQYRILGSTGLKVSVVGMGTWQFGGEWGKHFEQAEVNAMFNAAREAGINLIDTAECYGDHSSEAFIGEAIKRDRNNWILATKFGHLFHKPFTRSEPRDPDDVVKQVDDSLKALQTDHIDLLQYHSWGDEQFFNEDVLAVLHKLKDLGKLRHIGNSVGNNTNIKQVEASRKMGIEAIQIIYNRLDRGPEDTTFPICREQNLGVLARVPLASGYLSGKYGPEDADKFSDDEVRGRHGADHSREALEQAQKIKQDEVPDGVDMAQWALAWCLKHPAVTCVIPGCKSVEQVRSNAAAADLDTVPADHPQTVTDA